MVGRCYILMSAAALLMVDLVGASDFRYGRATFYGNEPWYWSIHDGACGYGYICPEVGTGWDVAALPDVHYEYSGSCGICYEVKCEPMHFHDGYGQVLDRSFQCHNPEESTVVTIVDTCPCQYANNAYSNKRWCCGDMDHFDLSVWAFEKLTDIKWGVIGLLYRPVPCGYKPEKQAYPRGAPHWGQNPGDYGASCPRELKTRNGQSSSTTRQIGWAPTFDWPTNTPAEPEPQPQPQPQPSPTPTFTLPPPVEIQERETETLFSGGQESGSWGVESWNTETWQAPGAGVHGGSALCNKVWNGGAVSFKGQQGALNDKVAFEFFAKTDHGVPEVYIDVTSSSSGCTPIKLSDIPKEWDENSYSKYKVDLNWFGDSDDELNVFLLGCNGQDVSNLEYISFKNLDGSEQQICLDGVELVTDTSMKAQVFNTPEAAPVPSPVPAPVVQEAPVQQQSSSQEKLLYKDGVESGWDLSSWSADAWEAPGWGLGDGTAICGKISPGGAISFYGGSGSFEGEHLLEFWLRVDYGVPSLNVNLATDQAACGSIPFNQIATTGKDGWYQRFAIKLSAFDSNNPNMDTFSGCAGYSAYDVTRISFLNEGSSDQWACLDDIKLWT